MVNMINLKLDVNIGRGKSPFRHKVQVQLLTYYTSEEYCDMIITHCEYGRNSEAVSQEYAIRFPDRRHPNRNAF
jgi:hypothetical protein